MTKNFHKHLLSELHMVVYQPGDPSRLNDRLLCEAVTVNENFQSLGYILRPEDLLKLAVSPSLHGFYMHVKALVPDVKAQPMYPGFPQQVMNMAEAEFRFHQLLHYLSTYTLEWATGVEVHRGWLPDYDGPQRTEPDTRLLDASVVELVNEETAAFSSLKILLSRRERLTNPELELVLESAAACSSEQMQKLTVSFKENLELLFPMLLEKADRKTALQTLRAICSHSGDVLRCSAEYLHRRRYHLRTSEKKLLVKLLESYSAENLRQNLMQSNSLRERNLLVLQYLDYNQYSRSAAHKEAVRALRNGELLSWHGIGESLLAEHSPKALTHLVQRPGYMLRMLNRLLSLGYGEQELLELLLPKAGEISAHLLVKIIRILSDRNSGVEEKFEAERQNICNAFARERWEYNSDCIEWEYESRRNELIFRFAEEMHHLLPEIRLRQAQEQCQENFRQERDAIWRELNSRKDKAERKIRRQLAPLEQELAQKEVALRNHRNTLVFVRWPYLRAVARYRMQQAGGPENTSDEVLARYLPERYRGEEVLIGEVTRLREQLNREKAKAEAMRAVELHRIEVETADACADALEEITLREEQALLALEQEFHRWQEGFAKERKELEHRHEAKLQELEAEYRKKTQESAYRRKTLQARLAEALANIEQRRQQILRMLEYNEPAIRILKEVLKEHFRRVSTPMKGKKVWFNMDPFDLAHSSLETEDRSKDGGYIRSGIAWKIPEGARYVRFFTYWNDRARIDIDLHAGGTTTDGRQLHVGWDAACCTDGVVHSGDITHSDAAEYIDIDLNAPIQEISANVNLFNGRSFRNIETCYVGMMAVDKIGQTVKHYDPANCFFTHQLTQDTSNLFYGYVDVRNRCVRFVGQPNAGNWDARPLLENAETMFSLQDYLDCVLEGQGVELVKTAEEADIALTMDKSLLDNGISLVDHNFFLEC